MTQRGKSTETRPADPDQQAIRLIELVTNAKSFAESKPKVALGQAREAAETICLWLFNHEFGKPSGVMMLDELIKKLQIAEVIPRSVAIPLQTVQGYGNFGVHAHLDYKPISPEWVAPCLSALNQVTRWYFVEYLRVPLPEELDGRGGGVAAEVGKATLAGPMSDRVAPPAGVAPVEAVKDPIDPVPASSVPVGSSPGSARSRASALLGEHYRDLGNGTLLDRQTELQWMRCALGQRWDGNTCVGEGNRLTWDEMQGQVDAFNRQGGFAGHDDWRVPTVGELKTLIIEDRGRCFDAVAFPNCREDWFWSSSPYPDRPSYALGVSFGDGGINGNDKSYTDSVRLVRGGSPSTPTGCSSGSASSATGPGSARVAAPAAAAQLIGERYRMESNLGLGGGESEIYLCLDAHLPAEHRDRQVVLKLYKTSLAPKKEVLDAIRNLSHADLIRVLDHGVWDGRFFEVMEYCRGGSMADTMPYPVGDLVGALDQIVNALDYCHHQLGIIHRDIKPNNLLFRDAARTDLVLTDFGISSYLRQWQKGGPDRTHTGAGRHTLDFAAPELFGQDEVTPKTDYYGLGITLIHLLTGRSPFEGLREETVVHQHVSNQIPLPEHLDERHKLLLRGLTQRTPENRWGYRQIRQWRQGVEILDDQGRPWKHRSHLDRPFPYYTQAKNPAELAHCLDRFDAAKRMTNHHISHWVAEFDPALAEEIEKLEETVRKNPALAVKKLGWLLDPESNPLIGGRYRDLGDGTVLDTETYLHWMRCALGQRWDGSTCVGEADELTWDKMFVQVDALNKQGGFAGHRDWRVPTIDELKTLLIEGREPAIDEVAFPNLPDRPWFWSSSPYAYGSGGAWFVDFGSGYVGYGGKGGTRYVRLVRAGQ